MNGDFKKRTDVYKTHQFNSLRFKFRQSHERMNTNRGQLVVDFVVCFACTYHDTWLIEWLRVHLYSLRMKWLFCFRLNTSDPHIHRLCWMEISKNAILLKNAIQPTIKGKPLSFIGISDCSELTPKTFERSESIFLFGNFIRCASDSSFGSVEITRSHIQTKIVFEWKIIQQKKWLA